MLRIDAYTLSLDMFGGELPEDGYLQAKELVKYLKIVNPESIYSFPRNTSNFLTTPEAIAAAKVLCSSKYGLSTVFDPGLLYSLCRNAPVFVGNNTDSFISPLKILNEEPSVSFATKRVEDGLAVSLCVNVDGEEVPVNPANFRVAQSKPLWLINNSILFPAGSSSNLFSSFINGSEVFIPEEHEDIFLDRYFTQVAESVSFGGDLQISGDLHAEPVKRLYLSEEDGELLVDLRFGYEEFEFDFDSKLPEESIAQKNIDGGKRLVRVHRKCEFESEANKILSKFGLKRNGKAGSFVLRQNTSPAEFLYGCIPGLVSSGFEIFGEEKIASVKINRSKPTFSIWVSSGIDWFDVKTLINFGGMEVSLKDVKTAVKKKQKFIKLSDGSLGLLPDDWVEKYSHLFNFGKECSDNIFRMPKHQVTLLEEMINGVDNSFTDAEFKERCRKLRDFSSIEPAGLPNNFNGKLRHYQKAGFDWLHFLHKYEFGGCLADDMGTGKTIQTLAFIQSLRESEHAVKPDLIIMPRSLIFNWERETAKFAPGLKTLTYTDKNRSRESGNFDGYDAVFTTYGLMLRDIDFLKKIDFHYVVLDESQAIKNPVSQRARAARHLKCDHRLVLTGTPVENNTLELWSQFSFINPGLLGNLDYFRNRFANPIEKNKDERTSESLKKIVFPFILRRTKDQVASELPPRTERILYCDMEPEQKRLYDSRREHYRSTLLGIIEDKGMNDARMKILEGLLRLRQICNHPLLVDENYKGASSKFDELFEILDTLRSENHKALIFSQFTKMLGLIRKELDNRKVPYVYLDGRTKNRSEQVDIFQNSPDIPFFLLSLKAGGLGLNLTAAEYVIHVDPWWNPAVEVQASDRAHRIGQKKPVFVYKMIMRDTVEEKVLNLQEKKKNLIDSIISSDSGLFKSLTGEDVKMLFS